ncbi:hypothetical protein [Tunturibacter empetritectus]|nr:hypothetical protein [Edaphobacter lichenicola]
MSGTAIVLSLVAFIGWQWHHFATRLQSMPVSIPKDLALDPLASVVVDPQLLDSLHDAQAGSSLPLLQRSAETPRYSKERAELALTWLRASRIFKATDWSALDGKILSSDTLTGISSESRVDAWNKPFCVLVEDKQVAFISSDGTVARDCNSLRHVAEKAVAASHDARLTRAGSLLVTVQSRSGGATAPESH